MVKAVAAGAPSLAPFFGESSGLGRDAQIRSQPARGSLQQGDTPGLYGGSKQPTICDAGKLERFLTDPANEQKARAWAQALDITTDGIPAYLDRLTPVLLRHDTLVKNHDYKKGKAVPFDSLLQAGIAVLVDSQGQPAVKCSCGNPLRPFDGDTGRISVEFEDGNRQWAGFDRSAVVAVRPAPRALERIALVDVADPDRGMNRPVGTAGGEDRAFDTRERRAVPNVAGTTFGEASRRLADKGLAVAFDGTGLPPDGARVTTSDPPAGTELRFGEYVLLSVGGGESGGSGGSDGPGGSGGSTSPPASGSSPSTDGPGSTPPSSSGGSPGSSSSPPSSGTTPSPPAPPSSPPPGSKPPATSTPPPADPPPSSPPTPPTSNPPETGSAPPPSASATSSAPVTSGPATSEPAGSTPVTGTATTSTPESRVPVTGAAASGVTT
ncbi:DUF6777 domain-containing protein [Streptomyces sp. 4N124]|uniref:DUF6777 domain-containing protein n=1 Tax=Streptomyces sp. 4N124 TaxID=3457420 RepID=UPI003FD5F9A9